MNGTLQARYVRCGRKNCRCAVDSSARHGPYWYLEWRKGRRIRKRYVPTRALETVRAAIASRLALEEAIRKSMADMAEMRQAIRMIRDAAPPRKRRGRKVPRFLKADERNYPAAAEYLKGTN